MKLFSAILLIVAMVLVIAVVPAFAGYKDQWVKFRATMTDRPDSKAVCFVLMPWPWKCACAPAPPPPPAPYSAPVDSDGDGVYDGTDECPGTPRGARVDAKGCPMDSDNDGVYDGIDQCPGTPTGARVDAKGCPSDADNDGVYDGIDTCPNTPAGARVDAKGCPMDSDNDGVYDGIDKCPNTPAGTKVDETGCPVEVQKFIDTGLISTTAILFDLNKATLKSESKTELDKIGNILIQASDLMVEIGGHTDATGSDATNMKLSDARAKAVHDYLEKNFPQIKPDNLTSKGYGESKPVASNDTKEGRAKNRRVEFKIMK